MEIKNKMIILLKQMKMNFGKVMIFEEQKLEKFIVSKQRLLQIKNFEPFDSKIIIVQNVL